MDKDIFLFRKKPSEDFPFDLETEIRRREAEREAENQPSWIREIQERRKREKKSEHQQ